MLITAPGNLTMNIDDLIQELESVREEHGNLSVIIPYSQAGDVKKLKAGDLEVDLIAEKQI